MIQTLDVPKHIQFVLNLPVLNNIMIPKLDVQFKQIYLLTHFFT